MEKVEFDSVSQLGDLHFFWCQCVYFIDYVDTNFLPLLNASVNTNSVNMIEIKHKRN